MKSGCRVDIAGQASASYSIAMEATSVFGGSSLLVSSMVLDFVGSAISSSSSSFSASPPRDPRGKVLSQFCVEETWEMTGIWTEELLSKPCSASSYCPRASSCSWLK
ncbi:hypothetical protein FKM82_024367 [Ascaphus truei]